MRDMDGRIVRLKKRLENSSEINQVIEEMAETFYLSPSYLNDLFKQQTGKTILQFDKDLRMEKAYQLLQTTHKSVKEIYHEVGLKDYSHFVRNFKKKYGISPKELQKRSWRDEANQNSDNDS